MFLRSSAICASMPASLARRAVRQVEAVQRNASSRISSTCCWSRTRSNRRLLPTDRISTSSQQPRCGAAALSNQSAKAEWRSFEAIGHRTQLPGIKVSAATIQPSKTERVNVSRLLQFDIRAGRRLQLAKLGVQLCDYFFEIWKGRLYSLN